jgi:hypothetical protein
VVSGEWWSGGIKEIGGKKGKREKRSSERAKLLFA